MEILTINIGANETKPYSVAGHYMEVIDSLNAVDVLMYGPTGSVESMRGAIAGSYAKEPFTNFIVTSATAQTLRVLVSDREGGSRRIAGQVTIGNSAGPYAQGAVAVTNAVGGVVVSAANPARRHGQYINTDPTAMQWLNVAGGAASAANGIPLEPGDSWSAAGFCPTGAISVISDTATAKGVWLEG